MECKYGFTIATEKRKTFENSAYNWSQSNYEILSEEDKEIDIQAIEELTKEIKRITADANNPHAYGMEIGSYDTIKMGNKINEVIKAVKYLDKKIKEK